MSEKELCYENSGYPVTDIEGGFAEVITLLVMEFGSFQKLDQFLEKVSHKSSMEDLSEHLKIRASFTLLKLIAEDNLEGLEALQQEITEKQKSKCNITVIK